MSQIKYLNSYATYNLWFFNFMSLCAGILLIISNVKENNSIPNCDNIYTIICFMLVGNVLPVLTFSQLLEFNIFSFLYSIVIVSYASYHYSKISDSCSDNYSKNYGNLWLFYSIQILIHGLNVALYAGKFYLYKYYVYFKSKREFSEDLGLGKTIANTHRSWPNIHQIPRNREETQHLIVGNNNENHHLPADNIYENDSD